MQSNPNALVIPLATAQQHPVNTLALWLCVLNRKTENVQQQKKYNEMFTEPLKNTQMQRH